MTLSLAPLLLVVTGLSWIVSVLLCVRLWRGEDELFFKLTLSLLLIVPIFGPFVYLWIQSFPPSQPQDLQDQYRSSDVLERWRHRLEGAGRLSSLKRWGAAQRGR